MKSVLKASLIRGVLSHEPLFRALRALLFDDRVYDKILSDDALSTRIFSYDHACDRILSDMRILEKILADERIANRGPLYKRLLATIEFHQAWQAVRPFVQADSVDMTLRYQAAQAKSRRGNRDVRNLILDVICEDGKVLLANGVMKFPDRHSLWTLIHEILINEDYYFETNTDAPRILDCGTHFGLAIYYFKSLYPQARITGFEPVPALRELALENARRNGYRDVEILPYALSDVDKVTTFIVSNTDSMAGSLTKRRRVAGDEVSEIEVECRRLSEFLQEPVHFLKLDIEGSEDVVLAEAEAFLGNVQHLFCEYHHGMGLDSDRLGKILLLLNRAGFEVQVGKSFCHQRSSMHRPATFVDQPYSAVLWAKNRTWKY